MNVLIIIYGKPKYTMTICHLKLVCHVIRFICNYTFVMMKYIQIYTTVYNHFALVVNTSKWYNVFKVFHLSARASVFKVYLSVLKQSHESVLSLSTLKIPFISLIF